MTESLETAPPEGGRRVERLLGRVEGQLPGPTLLAIGGVHGNEPAGVDALLLVLAALAGRTAELCGDLVALAGNRTALAAGRRYVDRDLNRAWTAERVAALRARRAAGPARAEDPLQVEDREQLELLAAIEEALARARGPLFVLDLHSTSGEGPPFVVLADTLKNRAFAAALPATVVVGLEEQLEGTLLSYLSDLGHTTVAFESGQHTSPRSVDRAQAALWLALSGAGLLASPNGLAGEISARALAEDGERLPPVVEVRYRHAIRAEDAFRMEPGFRNLQPVERGQVLASDRRGPVRSPQAGLILMPLYQPQGEDGFFLVRGFNPFWLRLSAALRRLGADRVVHWLPGVARHRERPATFFVDRRVARWYALEVFHLLGFRRVGGDERQLVVARRPHDVEADHAWGPG